MTLEAEKRKFRLIIMEQIFFVLITFTSSKEANFDHVVKLHEIELGKFVKYYAHELNDSPNLFQTQIMLFFEL